MLKTGRSCSRVIKISQVNPWGHPWSPWSACSAAQMLTAWHSGKESNGKDPAFVRWNTLPLKLYAQTVECHPGLLGTLALSCAVVPKQELKMNVQCGKAPCNLTLTESYWKTVLQSIQSITMFKPKNSKWLVIFLSVWLLRKLLPALMVSGDQKRCLQE